MARGNTVTFLEALTILTITGVLWVGINYAFHRYDRARRTK